MRTLCASVVIARLTPSNRRSIQKARIDETANDVVRSHPWKAAPPAFFDRNRIRMLLSWQVGALK
jgi:hypothetical protein